MEMATSENYYKWSSMTFNWYKFGNENNLWREIHNNMNRFISSSGALLIAVCFDETSHVVVRRTDYLQLKNELERATRRTLPDAGTTRLSSKNPSIYPASVRNMGDVKTLTRRLNQQNDVIRRQHQMEAKKYEQKVKEFLKSHPEDQLLVIDVEMYEHDHSIITEIGFVAFRYKQETTAEYHHYIVKENLNYVNKDFVPDNRKGFLPRLGTSQTVPLEEAKTALKSKLEQVTAVVGHNMKEDAKVLEGISIKEKFQIDTQQLALAQAGKPMPMRLGHVLREYGVPCDEKNHLHNAGNDCHYTMKAFEALTKFY